MQQVVSGLGSGAIGQGPAGGDCVVFLDKTLDSHSASLS